MAMLETLPTTDALSEAAGDAVGRIYEVDIGDNATANLLAQRNWVRVYLESGEMPAAVLRFGSLNSGALWVHDNLVGEFAREPSGSFAVTEIEDGFKKPFPITNTDPIKYLLDRLLNARRAQ